MSLTDFFKTYIYYKFIKNEFLNIRILSTEETIDKIINDELSIIRFGDGEFNIIKGGVGPGYQKNSLTLKKRMSSVLHSLNHPKLLICIPRYFSGNYIDQNKEKRNAKKFWRLYLVNNRSFIKETISINYEYGDSLMSRLYMDSIDRARSQRNFVKIKQIWENKEIVIIEGEKTRFGIGNDLLSNASSIKRIIVPSINAFEKFEQILFEARKIPKDRLFILSIGPTAKILAHQLFLDGYRVLDLGHLDIEYEWFLRKAKKKIEVPNKYTNESKSKYIKGKEDKETILQYKNQIISSIE